MGYLDPDGASGADPDVYTGAWDFRGGCLKNGQGACTDAGAF